MSNFKNKVFKLRLKLLYYSNNLKDYFTDGISINVVSTANYKNKIKDDLMLQKYLLKAGYHSKIVSWDDNVFGDIDIIRSVWGYHHRINEFLNYVSEHNTINNKDLIFNNIDKKKQYELLKANDIEPIETKFLNSISEYHYKGNKVVVKPIVSASGDNTFIIEKPEDLVKVNNLSNIMIQPYIEGINEGEISVITINRNIKYAIKRYPGVFTEYKKPEYISKFDLDKNITDLVKKVILIEDYKKAVIMRIDFVKDITGYKIMEIELVDPDLFIETIPDKKIKREVYQELVNAVSKYKL